jgi:hypothetical protein
MALAAAWVAAGGDAAALQEVASLVQHQRLNHSGLMAAVDSYTRRKNQHYYTAAATPGARAPGTPPDWDLAAVTTEDMCWS